MMINVFLLLDDDDSKERKESGFRNVCIDKDDQEFSFFFSFGQKQTQSFKLGKPTRQKSGKTSLECCQGK